MLISQGKVPQGGLSHKRENWERHGSQFPRMKVAQAPHGLKRVRRCWAPRSLLHLVSLLGGWSSLAWSPQEGHRYLLTLPGAKIEGTLVPWDGDQPVRTLNLERAGAATLRRRAPFSCCLYQGASGTGFLNLIERPEWVVTRVRVLFQCVESTRGAHSRDLCSWVGRACCEHGLPRNMQLWGPPEV